MASRRKGRVLALQALYSWEAAKPALPDLLSFDWMDEEKRQAIDEATAIFARHLIAGVIENVDHLDGLIKKQLKNWDFSRLNKVDLAILRISVYALLFQQDISPSIVIDEAVDLSKDYGTDDSYRFVNGVLDAIRRSLADQAKD